MQILQTSQQQQILPMKKSSGDSCLVCGESVVHRHFGERTCNSW